MLCDEGGRDAVGPTATRLDRRPPAEEEDGAVVEAAAAKEETERAVAPAEELLPRLVSAARHKLRSQSPRARAATAERSHSYTIAM